MESTVHEAETDKRTAFCLDESSFHNSESTVLQLCKRACNMNNQEESHNDLGFKRTLEVSKVAVGIVTQISEINKNEVKSEYICRSEEESDEKTREQNLENSFNGDVNSKIDYSVAASYWNNVPATVNGMLGGFGHISSTDISGSDSFLKCLFNLKDKPGHARCVDCGAGIGRITKRLLQRHFGKVDLVEQCSTFAEKAKINFAGNPKIGEIFCIGLQDFDPPPCTYDVIWIQWVIIYLPDQDLVAFLKRMSNALKPNGIVVLKDNFTTGNEEGSGDTILDEEDSSVTRPLDFIIKLATQAGLTLIRSVQQQKLPKKLFKVYMLAFRPECKTEL